MQTQVSQLGRALLPRNIKQDLLELTPRLSVRALSYRLLCHAEIEAYLEDRALEIANAADHAWKTRGHISRATFCLLAFSALPLAKLPDTLKPPPNKKGADWTALIAPDARLSKAITQYHSSVKMKNHGIKEENLISLLLPIGYDYTWLDETLITDLNDLGVKRGEAAHAGSYGQVTKGVNPKDEHDHIQRILVGMKGVDEALSQLLKRAQ